MRIDRIAFWVALGVIVLIPIRVMEQGWLPPDDALRHAAKAVSGKTWSEILILRPEATMDSHPGWHAILGAVHRATGAGAPALVLFSVISLFIAFSLPALLLLRRPEAWLLAFFALAVSDRNVIGRLFMGRPYELTAALLVLLLLVWPRLEDERAPRRLLLLLAAFFAVAAWTFPSWYLFAFPVAAFFLAGHPRAALRLALVAAAGVALAGLLTGQPIRFVIQSLLHPWMVFAGSRSPADLVGELQPFPGPAAFPFFLLSLLLLRAVRGRWTNDAVLHPAFVLAFMGWIAGFLATRFWVDWGVPAGLVWAALEIQDALEQWTTGHARARIAALAVPALALFLAVTSDIGGRWSRPDTKYVPLVAPSAREALPDEGGILYSDDLDLFFSTFYRLPHAPWRYMVGFEPGLMPPADREVLRTIQRERTPTAFAPWVERMRPADRLILRASGNPPTIPAIAWQALDGNLWSGRIAHPSSTAPSPAAP
jgi:hypothetical protein